VPTKDYEYDLLDTITGTVYPYRFRKGIIWPIIPKYCVIPQLIDRVISILNKAIDGLEDLNITLIEFEDES